MSTNLMQMPSNLLDKIYAFRHKPLDYSKPSIRIVQVLPSLSALDGLVQCTITHSTIDTEYTCLSYVWGKDDDQGGTILLNQQTYQVRYNLHSFLKVARTMYPGRRLWIDAICIDQATIEERNHQVQQMGQIYSHAVEVITWLGKDPLLGRALQLLKTSGLSFLSQKSWRLSLQAGTQKRLYKKKSIPVLFAAVDKYWSRAWVTQEIALARCVKLLGHRTELDLSFIDYWKLEKGVYKTIGIAEEHTSLYYLWQLAQKLPGENPLIELLERFSHKECSVPRDRIFSLLALSSKRGSNLTVDYQISDIQLLQRVVEASEDEPGGHVCLCRAIILLGALDILNQPPDSTRDLTSIALTLPFRRAEFQSGKWDGGWIEVDITASDHFICSRCGFETTSAILRPCRVFCFNACDRIHGHLLWEYGSNRSPPQPQAENINITAYARWWRVETRSLRHTEYVTVFEDPVTVPASYSGTTCTIQLTRPLLKILAEVEVFPAERRFCARLYEHQQRS